MSGNRVLGHPRGSRPIGPKFHGPAVTRSRSDRRGLGAAHIRRSCPVPMIHAVSGFMPSSYRGFPGFWRNRIQVHAREDIPAAIRAGGGQQHPDVDIELSMAAQARARNRLPALRNYRRKRRPEQPATAHVSTTIMAA